MTAYPRTRCSACGSAWDRACPICRAIDRAYCRRIEKRDLARAPGLHAMADGLPQKADETPGSIHRTLGHKNAPRNATQKAALDA